MTEPCSSIRIPHSANSKVKIMICGEDNSGKTTFLNYYLKRKLHEPKNIMNIAKKFEYFNNSAVLVDLYEVGDGPYQSFYKTSNGGLILFSNLQQLERSVQFISLFPSNSFKILVNNIQNSDDCSESAIINEKIEEICDNYSITCLPFQSSFESARNVIITFLNHTISPNLEKQNHERDIKLGLIGSESITYSILSKLSNKKVPKMHHLMITPNWFFFSFQQNNSKYSINSKIIPCDRKYSGIWSYFSKEIQYLMVIFDPSTNKLSDIHHILQSFSNFHCIILMVGSISNDSIMHFKEYVQQHDYPFLQADPNTEEGINSIKNIIVSSSYE